MISAADFTVQRVMLNLRYQAENWEFATELLRAGVLKMAENVLAFVIDDMAKARHLIGG